jgi:fermentation-respiration switch protein FrsA (DUF1100 family)
MVKKILKIAGLVLCALLVLCVVGLAVIKVVLDATYFRGYDPHAALDAQVVEVTELPAYVRTKLYFNGCRGDRVPTVLATPKDAKGPFPCVIFLHGIGDDKEFMAENKLDEPFVKAGFAFVCFDQLMRGERKLKKRGFLDQGEAFRVRAAYTVNDTRRLIDYLLTRPDIAAGRIYLCGASYGAITGSTAAAFDPRIRAVVLTYGGGSIRKMLGAEEIAKELGYWRFPAQVFAWYFGSVFDPTKYVGRIAPRPVLLQNGKQDTVVAPAAAKALQDAAREPKTVIWYEGDHLGKTSALDIPLVTRVLHDALVFIQEQDAKIVASQNPPKAS